MSAKLKTSAPVPAPVNDNSDWAFIQGPSLSRTESGVSSEARRMRKGKRRATVSSTDESDVSVMSPRESENTFSSCFSPRSTMSGEGAEFPFGSHSTGDETTFRIGSSSAYRIASVSQPPSRQGKRHDVDLERSARRLFPESLLQLSPDEEEEEFLSASEWDQSSSSGRKRLNSCSAASDTAHCIDASFDTEDTMDVDTLQPIHRILPRETFSAIMKHLDRQDLKECARVCKDWRELVYDGALWTVLDLFEHQSRIDDTVVRQLTARSHIYLRTLSLAGCTNVDSMAMSAVGRHCSLLKHLSLANCRSVENATIDVISSGCRLLEDLNLTNCVQVTDDALFMLGSRCKQLARLDLSMCSKITNTGIVDLATMLPKLKCLFIRHCKNVADGGLRALGKAGTSLRIIDIQGCRKVTDAGIRKLARHNPALLGICISDCAQLTDNALESLGQWCPKLKVVEAAGCSRFGDRGYDALTTGCSQLVRLDLEDNGAITDEALMSIARRCHRLESLVLSFCDNITDEAIQTLSNSCPFLAFLQMDNCGSITDTSLTSLSRLPLLRHVEIYDCRQLSEKAVRRLIQTCNRRGKAIRVISLYSLGTTGTSAMSRVIVSTAGRPRTPSAMADDFDTPPNLDDPDLYDFDIRHRCACTIL
eukprot:Clim_evm9s55 gene=Clim_evmTU9s55